MMWLAYASAWIATSAAVIAGIYLTGSAWCLWALFIPAMIIVTHNDDKNNEEMSGMRLAKRYKELLMDMGVKRLTVKVKIRSGEHWTKEMGKDAELNMRKMIYGSQY